MKEVIKMFALSMPAIQQQKNVIFTTARLARPAVRMLMEFIDIVWLPSPTSSLLSVHLDMLHWRTATITKPLRGRRQVSVSSLTSWGVTRLTYQYNHINYLHLCWRPQALSFWAVNCSGPSQAATVCSGGPTNQYVCVNVHEGPRRALQTGPAWSPGSRPDMTSIYFYSFPLLGRRPGKKKKKNAPVAFT